MTNGFDDPRVVQLDAFRPVVDHRTDDEKIAEAIRKQNQQSELNEAVEHLQQYTDDPDALLMPQTPIVRDSIMKMIREKLGKSGITSDHPNYWVINQALGEMIEVGLRVQDEEIAADLLMIDDSLFNGFDPRDYKEEIPEDGWLGN